MREKKEKSSFKEWGLKILEKCESNEIGIIVPGSSEHSDLTTPVPYIKYRLKEMLLETQLCDSFSQFDKKRCDEWNDENFFKIH